MWIKDGKEYLDNAELPDLGSVVCVCVAGGKREYRGLSSDFERFKQYAKTANMPTGSLIHLDDTDSTYEYFAFNQQWYPVSKGGSTGGSSSSGTSGSSYDFNVIGENLRITQHI